MNHPLGIFGEISGTYYNQDTEGRSSSLDDDEFWQMDLTIGWRSPRRHIEVMASLLNVTDQDYRLFPLNSYRDPLARHGMVLSGESPDGRLVEMIELPSHPYFVGCQFHPEFRSRPLDPHPLFVTFIRAAVEHVQRGQRGEARDVPARGQNGAATARA